MSFRSYPLTMSERLAKTAGPFWTVENHRLLLSLAPLAISSPEALTWNELELETFRGVQSMPSNAWAVLSEKVCAL